LEGKEVVGSVRACEQGVCLKSSQLNEEVVKIKGLSEKMTKPEWVNWDQENHQFLSIKWAGTRGSEYELRFCRGKHCTTVRTRNLMHTIRVEKGVKDYTFSVK